MTNPTHRSPTVLELLRQNEIGRRARIRTPFGPRLIHYADLTASGRYLHFVEAWIRRVRPFYANTHTEVSTTGKMLTHLREDARDIVRRAVNASAEHVVLFCGSGATAAVNKLVGLLGVRIPEPLERRYRLSEHIPADERPVVFVGPYEHHSNYLPWLESICDVREVPCDGKGRIDLDQLRDALQRFAARPLKIGAFSAASNVTGVLTDVRGLARVMHEGNGVAVFDYAAGAPYLPIDMSPADPLERIDAIFVSPHKFLGGPDGSGVLVAHRSLFESRIPERPGGGTVSYVSSVESRVVDYVTSHKDREEGGTPAILADLRAGTAFLVKEMVGAEAILAHELEMTRRAIAQLSQHPRIHILGPTNVDRIGILSFSIDGLHHDFASLLLDHLFGIQNRSGCACAGPYGHRLLGIDAARSERFRQLVARGIAAMKPGWVRLSLPYYATEDDFEFLMRAVTFVANHGHELLSHYVLSWRHGTWRHRDGELREAMPLELSVESLREAAQSFAAGDHETPLSEKQILRERERYFAEAEALVAHERAARGGEETSSGPKSGDAEVDELCWFRYVAADPITG